jgi:hypothetical protein
VQPVVGLQMTSQGRRALMPGTGEVKEGQPLADQLQLDAVDFPSGKHCPVKAEQTLQAFVRSVGRQGLLIHGRRLVEAAVVAWLLDLNAIANVADRLESARTATSASEALIAAVVKKRIPCREEICRPNPPALAAAGEFWHSGFFLESRPSVFLLIVRLM